MRRRGLILLAAGLAATVAAVLVIREGWPGADSLDPQPIRLTKFAADGVLLPAPGEVPPAPGSIDTKAGPRRLQLRWGPAVQGVAPRGAVGYEVRWGEHPDKLDRQRLIAEPAVQLDGLDNGRQYTVDVRAIDSFGRRSAPSRAIGIPKAGDPAPLSFVDDFDGDRLPDPARWQLANRGACAFAGAGLDDERHRLTVTGSCGAESTQLRARTPVTVDGGNATVAVDTTAPGPQGTLTIDLVPGPAEMIGGPSDAAAGADPTLPPGTVRARISAQHNADGSESTVAGVLHSPEMASDAQLVSVPHQLIGLTQRFTVDIRPDGVHLSADGSEITHVNIHPQWTQATLLIGFQGPAGNQWRAAVDRIAFTGGRTPDYTTPPALTVHEPGSAFYPATNLRQVSGVDGARLLLTLAPTQATDLSGLTATIGDTTVPVLPAIPGTTPTPGVRYPAYADFPAAAVRVDSNDHLDAGLNLANPAVDLVHADLELIPTPGTKPQRRDQPPPNALPLQPLAAPPVSTLLGAAGKPIPSGEPVPRGRAVLDVRLDGLGGQQFTGDLAGLAGVEVLLDGKLIATLPTAEQGPGVAGNWRFAVDMTRLSAGPHSIEARSVAVDPTIKEGASFVSFLVAQ
ncbi:fibronectin type III domain-containing protein [Pseudonocardiaceae bacterium YIM PH 21723]|nr:fibronectin type III domain-containing protein [Pseudonocardiaceae bacterium YIM PH 21723]